MRNLSGTKPHFNNLLLEADMTNGNTSRSLYKPLRSAIETNAHKPEQLMFNIYEKYTLRWTACGLVIRVPGYRS
jgi:hypothetical protein